MDVQARHKFQDEWLAKALLEYQIIEEGLFQELAHRFADEDYFFDVLLKRNYLSPEEIALFIEEVLQIPHIYLDSVTIQSKLIELIPEKICRNHLLIPFEEKGQYVSVASFNPFNMEAEKEVEYLTGKYVKSYFAFKDEILRKISEYYSPNKYIDSIVDRANIHKVVQIPGEAGGGGQSPVVKLVNLILGEAIDKEASDIHIEAKEKVVVVRLRIDGVLRNILEVPKSIHKALISRIKIISNLNIA